MNVLVLDLHFCFEEHWALLVIGFEHFIAVGVVICLSTAYDSGKGNDHRFMPFELDRKRNVLLRYKAAETISVE